MGQEGESALTGHLSAEGQQLVVAGSGQDPGQMADSDGAAELRQGNGQRSLDGGKKHGEDVLVLHDELGIAVGACQSGGLESSSLVHLPSQLFHVFVGRVETAKDADLLLLDGRLHKHPPLSQSQEQVISLVLMIPIALLALGRVLVVVDEVVDRRVAFLLGAACQPPVFVASPKYEQDLLQLVDWCSTT